MLIRSVPTSARKRRLPILIERFGFRGIRGSLLATDDVRSWTLQGSMRT